MDDAIETAARELVVRYGQEARASANDRAAGFAQGGQWPEHDVALRMLTAVERLLEERQ